MTGPATEGSTATRGRRYELDPEPTLTTLTVYASIGNSDDKLTQAQWAQFHEIFAALIRKGADRVYGDWHSLPNSPWQNACIAFEITAANAERLKAALADLATEFAQDSIAWAEAAGTQFLGPPATGPDPTEAT